jgi:hypothetical protein
MGPDSTFAYAQARLQARLGARPGDADWRRLQGVKEFGPFLETARTTPLQPWIEHLGAEGDVHELERGLRNHLNAVVEETAGWLPEPWRPAVRWAGWLSYLPTLQYLLHGEPALDWMGKDPALAPYLKDGAEERLLAMKLGELAPLATAWAEDRPLREGWLDGWRRLWPRQPSPEPLEALVDLVRSHLQSFADVPPENAVEARRGFEETLRPRFRRSLFHPAAAFVYLALTALDGEKVRAALVQRLLFGAGEGQP